MSYTASVSQVCVWSDQGQGQATWTQHSKGLGGVVGREAKRHEQTTTDADDMVSLGRRTAVRGDGEARRGVEGSGAQCSEERTTMEIELVAAFRTETARESRWMCDESFRRPGKIPSTTSSSCCDACPVKGLTLDNDAASASRQCPAMLIAGGLSSGSGPTRARTQRPEVG